jgi:integrase
MTVTAIAPLLPAAGPEGPWPAPDVLVLRGRVIRPGTPDSQMSRFGDPVWTLQPAHPDAHQGVGASHWEKFPPRLVLPFKTICLALLDHPVPESRGTRTGRDLAIMTVSDWVRHMRVLARWMDDRGLSLNGLTDRQLDAYRSHVTALSVPPDRKRDLLNTVVLIHAYRDLLPAECRLGTRSPWRGAEGENLIPVPPSGRVNKTRRIAPETMEPLLAWSLRMLEDIGPDIAAACRAWQQIRQCSHPSQEGFTGLSQRQRLAVLLARTAESGGVLPGKRDAAGRLVPDEHWLCRLLGAPPGVQALKSGLQRRMATGSGLPLAEGCPLGTPVTGMVDGRPWRDRPVTAEELPELTRVLTGALFVIVCYLSGMRPGEALNLRRGCRTSDPATGELMLVGRRGKGRGRTPLAGPGLAGDDLARRWVVVQPVHDAVALLEQIAPHAWLFPPVYHREALAWRSAEDHTRSSHYIADDIAAFIAWVNRTFIPADGSTPIPADPAGRLSVSRFRRTLAYFIVRRPRGLIAAALQYGHLATKVTMSYAGLFDAGWLDDVAVERLELVIEQAGQDHALLEDGEHVSGPSAAEYRARVERAAGFAGRVVTSVRNAERLLSHAGENIHHGDGMTCVWTKETAACRKARLAAGLPDADAPDDAECRTSCVNLAYTDRDILRLAGHLTVLEERAGDTLAPQPLRDRAAAQAAAVRAVIARHDQSRPQHAPIRED